MDNQLSKVAKPRHTYSVITLSLVLFLLGTIGVIAFQASRILRDLKENVNIIVELKNDVSQQEIKKLEGQIKTKKYLKPESLTFIDKEAGAAFLKEDFGEDIILFGLENPLHHIFTMNLRANYMQSDSLEWVRNDLKNEVPVLDVYYQENVISAISRNVNRIFYFILGLTLILSIVVFVIINHTVKLSLYANRLLIKKMQLVGASSRFIRRPYLLKSWLHGMISAVLATVLIILLATWVNQQLPELNLLNNLLDFTVLFIGILILGIGVNVISTYVTVNRYLNTSINELY